MGVTVFRFLRYMQRRTVLNVVLFLFRLNYVNCVKLSNVILDGAGHFNGRLWDCREVLSSVVSVETKKRTPWVLHGRFRSRATSRQVSKFVRGPDTVRRRRRRAEGSVRDLRPTSRPQFTPMTRNL